MSQEHPTPCREDGYASLPGLRRDDAPDSGKNIFFGEISVKRASIIIFIISLIFFKQVEAAGKRISPEEMQQLLTAVKKYNGEYCPPGIPIRHITRQALERLSQKALIRFDQIDLFQDVEISIDSQDPIFKSDLSINASSTMEGRYIPEEILDSSLGNLTPDSPLGRPNILPSKEIRILTKTFSIQRADGTTETITYHVPKLNSAPRLKNPESLSQGSDSVIPAK